MSFIDATRSVERQAFFNGQRLFADDLQAIEGFNREMRWLHNQSLHQPGIGNGFAVTGRRGDREVVVGPGYAVDDLGREIVLTSARTIPVPPVAGEVDGSAKRFVLTVAYPEDEDLEEVELRQGICETRGAVRLREEPIFCWIPLNPDGSPAQDQAEIVAGRLLVLAEAAVRDCKLDRNISIVQRRNARPPTQPYIATGLEAPTVWQEWDPWGGGNGEGEGGGGEEPEIRKLFQVVGGLKARIDTSVAGFLTTPLYFARIDGPRLIEETTDEQTTHLLLDGLLSIVDAGPTGFEAQVIVLQFDLPSSGDGGSGGGGSGGGGGGVINLIAEGLVEKLQSWQVGWMGVEG
jgi:hypothetical protein